MPWIEDVNAGRDLAYHFATELRRTVLSLKDLVDRHATETEDIPRGLQLKAVWRDFYNDSVLKTNFRAPSSSNSVSTGWAEILRWNEQYHRAFDTLDLAHQDGVQGRFALPAWLASQISVTHASEWSARFYNLSQAWQGALDELCDRLHLVCFNPSSDTKPQWRVVVDTFEADGFDATAVSLTNRDTGDHFTVSNATESYNYPGHAEDARVLTEMLNTIHTVLVSSA